MASDSLVNQLIIKQLLDLAKSAIETGKVPNALNEDALYDFDSVIEKLENIQNSSKDISPLKKNTLNSPSIQSNISKQDTFKKVAEALVDVMDGQKTDKIDKAAVLAVSNMLTELISKESNIIDIKTQTKTYSIKELIPYILFHSPNFLIESESVFPEPLLGYINNAISYTISCPINCPYKITCQNF